LEYVFYASLPSRDKVHKLCGELNVCTPLALTSLPSTYLSCAMPSMWIYAPWLMLGSTTINLGDASECLAGCTLMGMDPFDSDGVVDWDERFTCDDSAGCDVNTGDTLITWVGCGA
ncbi:unnamed protein product, partial [Scytosiphon promiscuus]